MSPKKPNWLFPGLTGPGLPPHRGSRRRVRQLRFGANWSLEMSLFVVAILALIAVLFARACTVQPTG